MHVHEKSGRTHKKKERKRNGQMHVHEKKYSRRTKKKKKKLNGWMHVHEKKKWMDPKKKKKKKEKKFDDEVTLSHVCKSIP